MELSHLRAAVWDFLVVETISILWLGWWREVLANKATHLWKQTGFVHKHKILEFEERIILILYSARKEKNSTNKSVIDLFALNYFNLIFNRNINRSTIVVLIYFTVLVQYLKSKNKKKIHFFHSRGLKLSSKIQRIHVKFHFLFSNKMSFFFLILSVEICQRNTIFFPLNIFFLFCHLIFRK